MTLQEVLKQNGLTNSQVKVAELVAQGFSNLEIANTLFNTVPTVKFHLTNIYKKLNLKSRAQLIVFSMPYSFDETSAADAYAESVVADPNPLVTIKLGEGETL